MKKVLMAVAMAAVCGLGHAEKKKYIALSFDDGPNTTTTVRMLEVLKKHGVKASFFVIGRNVDSESAKIMVRAHKEGHDIENHSMTHSGMPALTADSIRKEIEGTSAMIERYVGERPQFFRPPYIQVNGVMYDTIELPFICGEGCEDWVPAVPAEERERRMLASARNGLIYLLHDLKGNEATVEAVDRVIPQLKKQGFRFVTVRELFKKLKVKPKRGVLYSDILHDGKGGE